MTEGVATTAKIVLSSKSQSSDGQTFLSFTADYADGANKEWSKYTPSLSVSMTVLDEVADGWESGDHFDLVFKKREKAE